MLREAFSKEEEEECVCASFGVKAMFPLAVATSIDALAVGSGFAFSKTPLWFPAISMGVITALVSGSAVLLGSKIKRLAGEKQMMITGGCVLIAIGLKILFS